MRTLTVIAEMGSGGAEAVVDLLTRGALARGDEPVVASAGGWRAEALAADGVRTLSVPLAEAGPVPLLRAARVLRRTIRHGGIDLVHAHNVRATLAVRLALVGLADRPPVVSTVHGLADRDYPRAAAILGRGAELVVAVSHDVAARLEAGGLARPGLRVIENATAPVSREDRTLARAALGLAADVPVALCLARLSPPKRQDLLIEAWGEVPGYAVLLVAGDGPRREALERAVAASPAGDRIRLLGDRRDVARLLSACDALVLPTDREGLPMTVLEAMATGVPVVASDVGGLRSIDRHAITLVTAGSAAALARAVTDLFSDPAAGAAQVEAGRRLVQTRFSSSGMSTAYFSAYDEVLRKNSGPER